MNFLQDEGLRFAVFSLVLAAMAFWEQRAHPVDRRKGKAARWARHLTLAALNS